MLAQQDPIGVSRDAPAPRPDGGPPEPARGSRRRRRWRNRSPHEVLTLGETAKAERQIIRCDVAKAREAVTLLREELASLARANAEPSCALEPGRFDYADQLRRELAAAEARLGELRGRRQEVLLALRGLRSAAARLGRRDVAPP